MRCWRAYTPSFSSLIAAGMPAYSAGSFNATAHALQHNVEFMVELVGKKSRLVLEGFLRQVEGETTFADLLREKTTGTQYPWRTIRGSQQLDLLIHATKRALTAAGPRLVVTKAGDTESFDLTMVWTCALRWPKGTFEIRAWPITQQADRAKELSNSRSLRDYLTRG